MPEQPEILGQIDSGFESYKSLIVNAQSLYFKSYGRYWQGLWTHTERPMGGPEPPNNLHSKPTDEVKNWEEVLSSYEEIEFPEEMLSRMRIDTYVDMEGHGYIIYLETETNTDIWQRSFNVRHDKITDGQWANVPKVI